jgi:hypothetical protein
MNYTESEMKIIHKVFQHYLDSHDSDEETRDLYLKITPKAVEDLSWEFDNSSPIIHLDEDGNEDKNSPLSNPLDNHFKMMAHMVTNLTKKHK